MGKWMRFAIDRKRQMIAAAAAGVGTALMLAAMTQRATARTYVITDGQRVVTHTTFATNPDRVLGEAGLTLGDLDSYEMGGRDIRISRTQRITVRYHGYAQEVTSQGETVEALLKRCGLEPREGDILSREPQAPTWDGMVIRVDQVAVRQESYTASIPHEVVYCSDATLPRGTQEVLTQGADGELLCVAEVAYVNGRETERTILSRTMVSAPVTEIVAVGTGDAPETANPGDMPQIGDGFIRLPTGEVLTYYGTAQVRATAYTHTDEGCDRITYTGTTVRVGTVAVDPRYIPYGTRMFIVSDDGSYVYGLSVAEDCGGAIKRDRIDLYFPTYEECIQFGRRSCTIYFLG